MTIIKVSLLSVATILGASGCSTTGKSHDQYKMECMAYVDYEGCGQVFESRSDCEASINKMVRGKWSNKVVGAWAVEAV